ncbi:MAG: hypothetical protein O2856_04110 [Planctomycetota bacterium]|nr:hypothetical protein [Planctomycetota bacterium]
MKRIDCGRASANIGLHEERRDRTGQKKISGISLQDDLPRFQFRNLNQSRMVSGTALSGSQEAITGPESSNQLKQSDQIRSAH